LTIVENLLELHGGRIAAYSEGVGHGSTFTVTLPRAPEASLSQPTAQLPQRRSCAVPRRILIVDDNVDAAQTLGDLMRELGHEPKITHDALSALDVMASFEPTIALLDLGLPVMDGYELARRLRAAFKPEALRLIAVTGYGQEGDRRRAKEAGFDHHLVKPLDIDELVPLLEVD
jgi:CheY-like chemotaxis protein